MDFRYLFPILLFVSITNLSCKIDSKSNSVSSNWTNTKSSVGNTHFHYTNENKWIGAPIGITATKDAYFLDYKLKGNNELVSLTSNDMNTWKEVPTNHNIPKDKMNVSAFIYQSDSITSKEFIYANDLGQVFTTLSDQPLLESEFLKNVTGTKLFYDKGFKKWILLFSLANQVLFYNSADFKDWQYVSNFGSKDGYHGNAPWQSPDLFRINVGGNKLLKKWVLLISSTDGHPTKLGGTQYFVGDFNGKRFTNNNDFSKVLWLDWGADNVSGLTVQHVASDEPIFVGWMDANKYSSTNLQTKEKAFFTTPRKLELKDTYYGLKLFSTPITAFEKRRGTKISQRTVMLMDKENALTSKFSTPSEFIFEFTQKSNEGFTVEFSNEINERIDFSYSGIRKMFLINRKDAGQDLFPQITKQAEHYAPKFSTLSKMNVRILIDECSIEIFADDGLTVFSELIFPTKPLNQMKLWGMTGQITLDKMEIYEIN